MKQAYAFVRVIGLILLFWSYTWTAIISCILLMEIVGEDSDNKIAWIRNDTLRVILEVVVMIPTIMGFYYCPWLSPEVAHNSAIVASLLTVLSMLMCFAKPKREHLW